MDDAELIQAFIRVEREPDGVRIMVGMIEWEGCYNPTTVWVKGGRALRPTASQEQIDSAIKRILGFKKYFCVCSYCHEKNPEGWMYDDDVCQECAEKHFGVVY